jgi:polyphosphate kinase 2 (PPK2 family)
MPLSPRRLIAFARTFDDAYCVTSGEGFRLKDYDPDDIGRLGTKDKARAREALKLGIEHLAALQDRLYAQDRWAVLLIFQAMDAAGKDGAIDLRYPTVDQRKRRELAAARTLLMSE